MRRTTRPLPLLFAVLGHALLVLLFLMMERGRSQNPGEPVMVYVLPITETQVPPPVVSPEPRLRARRPDSRPAIPEAAPAAITAPSPAPEAAGTIHLPPTDWQRELQAAAQRSAIPDVDARQRSLDSRPKVLELPKVSDDPPPGTVTLEANGDRTVRYKNGWTCTSSDPPLAEHFSVWAQHRPPKCRLGARRPEYKLDVRKPRYLEQSLPDLGPAAESDPIH
jgi:hypothetical protein